MTCLNGTKCNGGRLESTLATFKIKMLRPKYAARYVTNTIVGDTLFFKEMSVGVGLKSKVYMEFSANGTTQLGETYIESNNFNMMMTKNLFLSYDLQSTDTIKGVDCKNYQIV